MKKILVIMMLLLVFPLFSKGFDFREVQIINTCFQGTWSLVGEADSKGKLVPQEETPMYIVSNLEIRDIEQKVLTVEAVGEGIINNKFISVIRFIDVPNRYWRLEQVNTKVGNLISLQVFDNSFNPPKQVEWKVFKVSTSTTLEPEYQAPRPVNDFKTQERVIR